jgi:hypothetical protein
MKSAKLIRMGGLGAVLGSPADEFDEFSPKVEKISGQREGGANRPGPVETST